ncbi:LysR substrate-binding domain-containing protein [Rhodococcus opacus]|uniref:LysR substrate-binding domain-containing protein n=1 Tax=Rhodococcus opacus TaxID=37919 RepID=UPI001C47C408|nr:LysR substrate-binding domain-containing protein [Rhodococcus opacus]MBV6756130.1 LysR family transcriptional regulator [Rhodococcus opacus]
MELHHIRAFLAVAEELHFGRAAARLRISQPPLTRAIQQLEHELGTALFDRSTRRVALTPTGQALLEPAADVVAACRRVESVAQAAGKGTIGRVRVAYAGASTHVLVGKLAKQMRAEFPGIQLELYSSNFALPALDKVIDGSMEIGLGRWDFIPAGIASTTMVAEQLVIAVPEGHPLAGEDTIAMAQLAGEPFVCLPPYAGSVLTDRLHRLSHRAGFAVEPAQIAPESWTLLSLVAAGIGVALTLSTIAENVVQPGVVFVPLSDEVEPVALKMVWREDTAGPGTASVLEAARSLVSG